VTDLPRAAPAAYSLQPKAFFLCFLRCLRVRIRRMSASQITTRLAPSPTGALHLGNVRTFVVNYVMARQRGWRVLMRVEDLDGPRIKAGSADGVLDELAWLGLEWDGPVVYQSHRADTYRQALEQLTQAGQAYPCVCTRGDIESAASAPHRGEHEIVYPGTCCNRYASAQAATAACGRPVAWRLRVGPMPIEVHDQFVGEHRFDLRKICGDFVIVKNDGTAAYQLAVVIDDAQAGVTAIVRGDDLLDSAARQIHLRTLLGLPNDMQYWHLPLVVGPDGRRLAKRHGDTRLSHYRSLGCRVERILGLVAYWSGALPTRQECSMAELIAAFSIDRMPREQVVFGPDDEEFLTLR